MVISFSGDFPKEKIISLIEKKIKETSLAVKLKSPPPRTLRGLNIRCEKKPLEQTHLCLGFRGVSYLSKERLAAQLINIILGANMSSRLFEELREKKSLCYEISSEARKYKDSGAFIIHSGLDKQRVMIAFSAILKQLKKIKQQEVSFQELNRAKDYLLGQTAMSLEQPQARMFYLAESYLTLGRIYDFEDIKKEVEEIIPLQIKNLANQIFKFNNMCVSCVGDMEAGLEKKIRKAAIEHS